MPAAKVSTWVARFDVERIPIWLMPRVAKVQPATFDAVPKEVPRKWKSRRRETSARRMGMISTRAWRRTPRVALPARTQNWAEEKSSTWKIPSPGAGPHMTRKATSPAMPTMLLTTGAHM